MRKLLWNGCVGFVLLFIMSNAQQTSAQQPGLEQAREPVSVTGNFGDRSSGVKPRSGEDETKPGAVVSTVRRVRRIRRDPLIRVTKAERPQASDPVSQREEFRAGLELSVEPASETGNFGEKADARQTEFGDEDGKPGVVLSTVDDRPLSTEEPRRVNRIRRDPKIKVIKGNRP